MKRLVARNATRVVAFMAALGVLIGCGGGGGGGGGGGNGGGAVAAKAPEFSNPPEVSSDAGVLDTTLTVVPAVLKVGKEEVTFFNLYNGLYVPPTLRVQPGDQINLLLRNYAIENTNMHYHGLSVTPQGAGDNIYISVTPGDSFMYDFEIPANHPQGLFWYHPHFDPLLNPQIAAGMSGAMIIGDILAPFPELADIPERVMVLKDLKTEGGQPVYDPDPSGKTTRTINGLFKPEIVMTPGQMEFWRIGNQSSNIFYEFTMGGQPFHVIGIDGNLQNQVTTTTTLVMPPGSRMEALVYGPPKGKFKLRTEKFNTGPDGDSYPGQVLATVKVEGDEVPQIPLPTDFPEVPDLSQGDITGSKTVVFSDTANRNQFYIDGKPFSATCVDYLVDLGSTEVWTLQNTSQEAHVFHIHQLDFQVQSVNGVPKTFTGHQDVVTLPPAADEFTPSEVEVIIPFTDPIMAGQFVYHCHIIQHEDQGMMASIFVQAPGEPPPDSPMCQ